MMKNWLIGACGLLALALLGASAIAEPIPQRRPDPPAGTLIESLSLADARKLLIEQHYRTESIEAPGSPYLKTQSGAGFFFLSLYDCTNVAKAEDCHALELTSGAFTIRPAPSGEELARWNAASPFGFGVLDSSGSPYLRATLILSGGVSEAHIKASLTLWAARMTAFSKFIETAAAPPSAAATPNAESGPAAPAALH
jgi:Putative bacterial sensory transduction regulator